MLSKPEFKIQTRVIKVKNQLKVLLLTIGVFSSHCFLTNSALAQTWTADSLQGGGWNAAGSSADGNVLIMTAVGINEGMYISTNSGATWITSDFPTNSETLWSSLASSADGSKWITSTGGDRHGFKSTYTSTNMGLTWTSNNVGWRNGLPSHRRLMEQNWWQ